MTGYQLLIDPRTGDTVEIVLDLAECTLEIADASHRCESEAALEAEYRAAATAYYGRGWVDNETGSARLLSFAQIVEADAIASRISVPDDDWADAELAAIVDVILAISVTVRAHPSAAPILQIRVGRGEFDYATVAIDGTELLASARDPDNPQFFSWAELLLDLYEATTGSDAVQLHHAELLGARVAARIEADALLPTDVAARLAPSCSIHVCSFEEPGNSPAERAAAAASLAVPLSVYFSQRLEAE